MFLDLDNDTVLIKILKPCIFGLALSLCTRALTVLGGGGGDPRPPHDFFDCRTLKDRKCGGHGVSKPKFVSGIRILFRLLTKYEDLNPLFYYMKL